MRTQHLFQDLRTQLMRVVAVNGLSFGDAIRARAMPMQHRKYQSQRAYEFVCDCDAVPQAFVTQVVKRVTSQGQRNDHA